MPKTVIAKYPGRTAPIPAPTQAVASNALKETRKGVKEMALAIQEAKLAKERAEIREVLQRYQQEEEEKAKCKKSSSKL